MTLVDIVDLSSDDEPEEVVVKAVKLEADLVGRALQLKNCSKVELVKHQMLKTKSSIQGNEENGSVKSLKADHNITNQGQSSANDTSTLLRSQAPICRQFWKAGNYNDGLGSKVTPQNGKNYLQVHPMFLHSNATSHKWAFGAIAELLDNAIDEIQNGATFVVVDEISNPRDGNPALLIQDDGGGMDPIAMRGCLSFGFSEKSKSSIGRYGNGFKTSTMRLGADVIVFSRHLDKRVLTQSIGLLSYTFLRKENYDRIVVPMVHYEFNTSTGTLDFLHGKEHFMSNLLMLLQWSPFATEAELLKQFDDIGPQGTKVIVYNLWANDDGIVELDFNTDPRDIIISGDTRKIQTIPAWKLINEQHIGNRYHYSLRVYLSILYLRIPASFRIILRGEVVEHHNIADDLKFPQFILYKPQNAGTVEGQIITTIGFLKDAPNVNIHGFNVYHKNRLILPFWPVVSYADSRGRGVVGVLETNFIEPTHNKQDFEKTSLFQKLESRLKEMTWEYWDFHCGLIGYLVKKKHPTQNIPPLLSSKATSNHKSSGVGTAKESQIRSGLCLPNSKSRHEQGLQLKRKDNFEEIQNLKRQAVGVNNRSTNGQSKNQEKAIVLQENETLRANCLKYSKEEEELHVMVTQLKSEIEKVDNEYARLLAELQEIEKVKPEKGV